MTDCYMKRSLVLNNTTPLDASVGLIVLVPEVATAKTVRFTLDELYRLADAAVVGEVHGVITVGCHRYADIHVHEVIKGDADPIIRVIGESSWRTTHDNLLPGDKVLLFLGKREVTRATTLPLHGYVPFAGRDRVRKLADDVQRQDVQAVLTNEVFARYLTTLELAS